MTYVSVKKEEEVKLLFLNYMVSVELNSCTIPRTKSVGASLLLCTYVSH